MILGVPSQKDYKKSHPATKDSEYDTLEVIDGTRRTYNFRISKPMQSLNSTALKPPVLESIQAGH